MGSYPCNSPNAVRRAVKEVIEGAGPTNREWWYFQSKADGSIHAIDRSLVPSKDPTLAKEEIEAIFENIGESFVRVENQDAMFFRAEAPLETDDWIGRGRILFSILSDRLTLRPSVIIVTTAFRVSGWRSA